MTANKQTWIDEVKIAIINKAKLDTMDKGYQLEALEKQASNTLGLKRCMRGNNDSVLFYAGCLVKHFKLDVRKKPTTPQSRSKCEDALSRNHGKRLRVGKLGAASSVRIIDPTTVDLSKYLDK
jgi:hypothetical protein